MLLQFCPTFLLCVCMIAATNIKIQLYFTAWDAEANILLLYALKIDYTSAPLSSSHHPSIPVPSITTHSPISSSLPSLPFPLPLFLTSISIALLTIVVASSSLAQRWCSLRAAFMRTTLSSTILPSCVIWGGWHYKVVRNILKVIQVGGSCRDSVK